MVTSGPLNTLGSFMSFQMYRCLVEPLYLSGVNCVAHHWRTSGLADVQVGGGAWGGGWAAAAAPAGLNEDRSREDPAELELKPACQAQVVPGVPRDIRVWAGQQLLQECPAQVGLTHMWRATLCCVGLQVISKRSCLSCSAAAPPPTWLNAPCINQAAAD